MFFVDMIDFIGFNHAMFGKIFTSLFTGSMYGSGAPAFSVMSYVIANQRPDSLKPELMTRFTVEINIRDLANRIGEPEEVIQKAIDFLCAPDPHSRSEAEGGRRLVKLGAFEYWVVNGLQYFKVRNEEDRKEKNRIRQRKHRQKIQRAHIPGERAYDLAERNGASQEQLDAISSENLPKKSTTIKPFPGESDTEWAEPEI